MFTLLVLLFFSGDIKNRSSEKKALKMTSQLELFNFFFRTLNPKSEKKSRKSTRVRTGKLFFLFLNQKICCGYSKEPSQ